MASVTLVLLLSTLGWLPGARATPLPASLLWVGVMAAYCVGVVSHARCPLGRRWVWGVGLALRAALFPLVPHYSDDVYRYLWDGWVQTQGINPFLHAPASPALAGLRTEWWPLVNHPDVSTIYPPAAQLVFWGLATIATSVPLFKLAWLAADLATAWLVNRIATMRAHGDHEASRHGASDTSSVPLALYLWSPLLTLEVAWSGHLEPLGILPMMAAVWAFERRQARSSRMDAAGAFLGLGAAVKFAPAVALPALVRRRGFVPLVGASLALGLVTLPYLGAGSALFTGLGTYAERWAFNAGLFRVLDALMPGTLWPRIVAAGVVAGVASWAAWQRWTLSRALFWTLGAGLVLSPTLHPWYVLWILPFAALARSRAWVLLTGSVFFAYWGRDAYHSVGVWPFPWWLVALVWLPFGLLLVADAVAAYRLACGGDVAGRE